MTDSELLASVFGDETHLLGEACARWIVASRPFRAFFEANAGKIRKKARMAGDAEGLRDLRLELDAAYHLLADRRVTLVYERYLAEKARGPDLTATFKGHVMFNVEVRRLRAAATDAKLADTVCEKLRQMPPSAVNVLLIGLKTGGAPLDSPLDPAASLKGLIQRAEAMHDDFFAQRGWRDAREFLRAHLRLGGVLLRFNWDEEAAPRSVLWLNPQARHPISPDIQKLLRW